MIRRADTSRFGRSTSRGAALVEALCVIPIMVLFFVGMLYFENSYHQKLVTQNLARAATVAYAMAGCPNSNALIQQYASGVGSGNLQNAGSTIPSLTIQIGAQQIGSLSGFDGAPTLEDGIVAQVDTQSGAGVQAGSPGLNNALGFHMNVTSTSYSPCSDGMAAGNFPIVVKSVEIFFPF